MLQKWKVILTNWINCYFSESDKREERVTLESLLNIISHLRDNLNLDESKSSILEAHTVEEFLREKYPSFCFNDGSLEASSEDEIYIVASLLLYFVCVNSKDMNIKHAMCSQLSSEDQETILKFSKCLMECAPLTYKDVQAAVAEACGQDSSSISSSSSHMVSETPPALRSLHGEVRRLQAALDAERFDRNYLQEELARTNLRVEKLVKDKEQYKLDIVNLKAKISMCCGQETDAQAGDAANEGVAKLMRQLEDTEERLVLTQGQLDDAQYERDAYKDKINELKQERDKWLAVSQQEASRVSQLSEELEGERRHVASLRELVAELRQHNQLNRLDSSLLECDDPDASIHSLHHNLSVCSEACANVVEVQLGEERAKIVVLKQQIQTLQDQLNDLTQKTATEKQIFETALSDRENDIINLKFSISEEIEEKNNIKKQYSNDMAKLNDEINKLEEKIKNNEHQSRIMLESKMHEIQTLQEEKLSLLQSFNDETTKLDNIIKNLKFEFDAEKTSNIQMKEQYEKLISKLNEEVLDGYNNIILLKQQIQTLQEQFIDLTQKSETEKQYIEEVITEKDKYILNLKHSIDKEIKEKNTMALHYNDEISKLNDEIVRLGLQLKENDHHYQTVVEGKTQEIQIVQEQIHTLQQLRTDETTKFENIIENLNLQLDTEKKININMREDYEKQTIELNEMIGNKNNETEAFKQQIQTLQEQFNDFTQKSNAEKQSLKEVLFEKENDIFHLKQSINEEINKKNSIQINLSKEITKLSDEFNELEQKLKDNDHQFQIIVETKLQEIQTLQEENLKLSQSLTNETTKFENIIKNLQSDLAAEKSLNIKLREEYDSQVIDLNGKLLESNNEIMILNQNIETLQDQYNDLSQKSEIEKQTLECDLSKKDKDILNLKQSIKDGTEEKNDLTKHYTNEINKLNNEVDTLEQKLKDNEIQTRTIVEAKLQEIQTLQEEKLILLQSLTNEATKFDNISENLKSELEAEKSSNIKMREDYDKQIIKLNEKLLESNNEITVLKQKLQVLQDQLNDLSQKSEIEKHFLEQVVSEKENDILNLKQSITKGIEEQHNMTIHYNNEITNLNNKIDKLEQKIKENDHQNREIVKAKLHEIRTLQEEKLMLLQSITNETTKFENIIKNLESELDVEKTSMIKVKKDYENQIMKLNQEDLNKSNEILALQKQLQTLQDQLNDLSQKSDSEKQYLETVLSEKETDVLNLKHTVEEEKTIMTLNYSNEINKLNNEISTLEQKLKDCEQQSKKIVEEKIQEIQSLQKEIFILNQSYTEATTEFENIIENIRSELDAEKILKIKMKEEYETHEMQLNEKDLSRTDKIEALKQQIQILELQSNDLSAKNELEKQTFEKVLSEKDNDIVNLKQNINELQRTINEEIVEKNNLTKKYVNEIANLNNNIEELEQKTEDNYKQSLFMEETKMQEIKALQDEKLSLLHNLADETTNFENIIKNLKSELDAEKTSKIKIREAYENNEFKVNENVLAKDNEILELKQQIQELQGHSVDLAHKYDTEKQTFGKVISDKENDLFELNQSINKEIEEKQQMKIHYDSKITELNGEIIKLKRKLQDNNVQCRHLVETKMQEIHTLQEDKLSLLHSLNADTSKLEIIINNLKSELDAKIKMWEDLENHTITQNEIIFAANNEIVELKQQIQTLQEKMKDCIQKCETEKQNLEKVVSEKENEIDKLQCTINKEIEEKDDRTKQYINEINKLNDELHMLKDSNYQSQVKYETTMQEIQKLQEENKCLLQSHTDEITKLEDIIKNLKTELDAEKSRTIKMEEHFENYTMKLNKHDMDRDSENVVLKDQIKSLQEQYNELTQKTKTEKQTLEKELSEREKYILNLKHNINEEIQQKKNKEIQHKNEMNKLNNKMQEIQTRLEEKLSLLQNITDETTKLEDDIKILKSELDVAKSSNIQVKNDYENRIMRINEMVNDRDNEIDAFKQQIQSLQDQYDDMSQKTETEKQSIERVLSERENIIFNLKHRINEEIEEKSNLTKHYSNEMTKLNNEMNELEQKLKDNDYQHQMMVETKMQEIQTLQEEKRSLLQTLTDETNRLESINKTLHSELDVEKNARLKMRDDYDNHKMKLNEKVLNRNNELVELQNDIFEKSDKIESLYLELRKEKEAREELIAKHKEEYEQINQMLLDSEKGHQNDIAMLQEEIKTLKSMAETHEQDLKEKYDLIQEKDEQINKINSELAEVTDVKEKYQAELDTKIAEVNKLKHKLESGHNEEIQKALRSEEWVKAIAQRDIFAVAVSEKTGSHKNSCNIEKEYREFQHQVDNTTSDLTHSSMESIKTISDLEKIIYDKNRTITTLQSDITYLKSLIADSENKLLDINNELEVSKENCAQLSTQLKKIVHQKNEEIAELKKQVNKMSVTENRASQIIKVSAKYQAIILKRIAEIKSNTVLKELTNFGNSANSDNDLRRSLNAGTVTMEDLENFLDTTDKHLKRCSEKQLALQKERDRLTEVNRINESEIINLKKFLTELSVSFKTFSTVKDLYAQKFSRVVSVQRTVRREILSLDGHINDATMCKLERGYAAVMQDLSECVMNMERWVERCIGRTISPEKIKQAFMVDEDRASFVSTTFQNTALEVQLEELENSFQKLLEEVVRAQKGEGARDAQSVTVMEIRAEYEDKLNRMKAKMKQLCQEQIAVYKDKQREEVMMLERELAKTREKMAESSKAYEEHIRALTTELWSVGEKFLTKKDEVDWLRKKQRSGSLMSLQHVHSSGLVPPPEEPSRPSDTYSLRSLPVHNNTNTNKRDKEGRGLHMSDEEGEVFDNRWLKELASTPRRAPSPPRDTGRRLSELRWRNSLCPPHLKSSYPAETQFQPVVDEEDIKFSLGNMNSLSARNQRKEVGITAYKKPGPPTPSKSAGRLSATDSELRESLRVEAEPQASRKTSTPSRLRSLFRSNKSYTTTEQAAGTPRSRRLSIFRKK